MAIEYGGETKEHRKARDELLEAEIALRDQRERVAALRRQLPTNPVDTDYTFREGPVDLEKFLAPSPDAMEHGRGVAFGGR